MSSFEKPFAFVCCHDNIICCLVSRSNVKVTTDLNTIVKHWNKRKKYNVVVRQRF